MTYFMAVVPIATSGPTTVSRTGSFFAQGRAFYNSTAGKIEVVVMGDNGAPAMSTTYHCITDGTALPASIATYIDSVMVSGTLTHVFQLS